MVKLGRLWGDAKFVSLSPISKLLYCYLSSQANLSTLGVLEVSLPLVCQQLDIDIKTYCQSREELEEVGFILSIQRDKKWDTVVVAHHFKTLPKSKTSIKNAIHEGKNADPDLKQLFKGLFTGADFEGKDTFKAPTPQEVSEYANSLGYDVNGKAFCDYYGDNDWYDKNNKKVRNWKAKVNKVWCREENKLQSVEGAPKGYEYFFVDLEDGVRVFPESWKDGLPSHSNYVYAKYLQDHYNND